MTKRNSNYRRGRAEQRRGVLLLVCMVVLILFLLTCMTFALHAKLWSLGAQSHAAAGQAVDARWQDDLRGILMSFVRGDQNPMSPFRYNNLLDDLYGNDSISGAVVAWPPALLNPTGGTTAVTGGPRAGGQFFALAVSQASASGSLNPVNGYYNGRVLSIVSGSAAVESFRIVNYRRYTDTSSNVFGLFVIAPTGNDGPVESGARRYPLDGDIVLINGRPFNGTGLGFDPATGTVTEQKGALLPNLVYSMARSTAPNYTSLAGGGDEDYDAADYNNMWLAAISSAGVLRPSWHDPALIGHGHTASGVTQRMYTFRPSGGGSGDHPAFPALGSQWDVDNDGDGVPDSVWIYPGVSPRRGPDGRLYVPLVAMLVVDTGGKVNLNTAGTNAIPVTGAIAADDTFFAGDPTLSVLPEGTGFGPAEINPLHVLNGDTTVRTNVIGSRLGTDGTPGSSGEGLLSLLLQTSHFGGAAGFGPLDVWGTSSVAVDDYGRPRTVSLYPSDVTTPELFIADDPYEQVLDPAAAVGTDAPFLAEEVEAIYRSADVDASLLSQRLVNLLNPLGITIDGPGATIGHASWSLPVFSPLPPAQIRGAFTAASVPPMNLHLTDFFRAKAPTVPDFNPFFAGSALGVTGRYLPFDLMAGLRMDVNRPFGNGRNDGTPGAPSPVADEVQEAAGEYVYGTDTQAAADSVVPGQFATNVVFDHNNDGTSSTADKLARYNYAKQIFLLLMLLSDDDAHLNVTFAQSLPDDDAKRQLYVRRLAQYAVNVVDFRDPDSIMTPFEYDQEPFDAGGWEVDGAVGTTTDPDRGVVWGSEAPTLLLSEVLATHDARLDDTDEDMETEKTTTAQTDPDPHYDSVAPPVASLFIELYCAANPYIGSPGALGKWGADGDDIVRAPGDLFEHGTNVLRVSRANGMGQPYWRILISEPHTQANSVAARLSSRPDTTTLQPDRFDLFLDPLDPQATVPIERAVWFTSASPTDLTDYMPGPAAPPGFRLFKNTVAALNLGLNPGDYLVIGPRETTEMGLKNDGSGFPSDQKFVLTPGNPGAGNILLTNTAGGTVSPPTTVRDPAVMIAQSSDLGFPVGLNVSAPTDFYASVSGGTPVVDEGGKFATPIGTPLDSNASTPVGTLLAENGQTAVTSQTYLNFRTIFLQRLADPTEPWNATTNPYITVDFMPVDLNVFNGDRSGANKDEAAPNPNALIFGSRQRGNSSYNFWRPAIDAVNRPTAPATAGSAMSYLDFEVKSTLGYLNRIPGASGFVFELLANGGGAPARPFPWLVWNDRPFTTPYELMQVPASSASRLLLEYGDTITQGARNGYTGSETSFPHLLNFFYSRDNSNALVQATNFYRLFDFLQVPSHYVEAHTILNAAALAQPGATALDPGVLDGTWTDTAGFHPPFNVLSKYREPGRINLNTIYDEDVFKALMNGRSGPTWAQFLASRNGSGPSYVNNPFRSAAGWDLHPVASVVNARTNGGIDVTLLRPRTSGSSTPLFAPPTSTADYNSTQRNSYFAYESIQRLGNLVTTQSNVYAVWMTVGYFEVTEGAVDAAHPDGIYLGAEMGTDTGDIRRHRAFFIVDRSIPVAYENGHDHNADKTIRLQRFIE
ncbi:MAG: hypothetical protein DWQ31_20645 [Planctomycetota bacterium]|nr:MAG: hypothetical protein DWQ31_20645 [Planctomycetota bacterium]REJ96697.1 MAG: hypothetical protein DWQ35_03770 [Planctomycetota bacterium]